MKEMQIKKLCAVPILTLHFGKEKRKLKFRPA